MTANLTQDNLSHENLLKLFPTRQQRLEQMKVSLQNIRLAGSKLDSASKYEQEAILDYVFMHHLIMKRLFDLNQQESAGGNDERD